MDEGSFLVKACSEYMVDTFGMSVEMANKLDGTLLFFAIILVAYLITLILKRILIPIVGKVVAKTENKWDDLLVDGHVVMYVSHIIPVYFVYRVIPYAFINNSVWLHWVQKLVLILIIALLVCLTNACINVVDDIIEGKDALKGHPYKLIFQVFKVIVFLVGLICIIAVVVNRSPTVLLTGLGASAAIVSLVFKDTIVGFVSGLQLTANGMVKKGDWITLPSMNVDGRVQEMSLHTVKVLNFDKSVVTIPPSTLINNTFLNWSRMQEEGARRICRSVLIDTDSIHIITDAEKKALRNLPYMPAILDAASKAGNRMPDGGVMSNLALFREFMISYVKDHPRLVKNEYHMVRQMAPTEHGLPLQIFFFVNETRWVPFENLQSSVFDHVYASLPVFGLRAFQTVIHEDKAKKK